MKLGATLALLLCMALAQAQIYKWTDAKGVVHYSDKPAPGKAKAAALPPVPEPAPSAALPYALADAVRNYPVTLYSARPCGACDQGRDFLKRRGIPFVEKRVASDADEAVLKQAGSDGRVPLLLVGRSKLIGFAADDWDKALDAAAYPASSMLPAGYRYRAAEAAAGAPALAVTPAPAEGAEPAAAPAAPTQKREPSTLPPGFQF